MAKRPVNPVAKALRLGPLKPQVVKAKKGRGSYSRKGKSNVGQ